jgi:plastocyanin
VNKLIVTLAALVAAAAVAIPALAGTTSVKIGDNFFVRPANNATVTVKKGTTVKWRFTGQITHNVTVSKGPQGFHSPARSSGSYSHKMTKKGTYKIICTFHPGMQMTLKVK